MRPRICLLWSYSNFIPFFGAMISFSSARPCVKKLAVTHGPFNSTMTGDTELMPPPPAPVLRSKEPQGGAVEETLTAEGVPNGAPVEDKEMQEADNGGNGANGANGNVRKAKKKNKKKEKRKEKRQQQAMERKQVEEHLVLDPVHKARMDYEERLQKEQEERELMENEYARKMWEERERQIQIEIEKKKAEEEVKRLELEEKKRLEAEEREVGVSTSYNILFCFFF